MSKKLYLYLIAEEAYVVAGDNVEALGLFSDSCDIDDIDMDEVEQMHDDWVVPLELCEQAAIDSDGTLTASVFAGLYLEGLVELCLS
jgi:hypothetical protein